MKKLFPFDECYLVNLVERPDRLEYMMNQFKLLKCENEIILHRAVKHPDWIVEKIHSGINNSFMDEEYRGIVDVPHSTSGYREQYTIIKSAYLRGLETIMIIEDDCGFIKDRSILEEYFSNLPNDWDILRINCLRGPKTQEYINKYKDKYNYWLPQITCIYGAAAYALNRNGMKYILDWYELYCGAIDVPLCFGNATKYMDELKHYTKTPILTNNIKFYIPEIPLGLCTEMNLKSDLHQQHIDNNPYSLYHIFKFIKNIDLNNYF